MDYPKTKQGLRMPFLHPELSIQERVELDYFSLDAHYRLIKRDILCLYRKLHMKLKIKPRTSEAHSDINRLKCMVYKRK
jgi:hypothetical protein